MCGIFGIIGKYEKKDLNNLVLHSMQRGVDSSGLIYDLGNKYEIRRADFSIRELLEKGRHSKSKIILGHSRLITNGLLDNQPVVKEDVFVIHNGIIVNDDDIWSTLKVKREFTIDTEVINAISIEHLNEGLELDDLGPKILRLCKGTLSAIVMFPKIGKIVLLSNNGSLYFGYKNSTLYFASENFALEKIKCLDIKQILNESITIDIPKIDEWEIFDEPNRRTSNLIPNLKFDKVLASLLEYKVPNLRRCTKCILPETMPYIEFDDEGVCNYCKNYKNKNGAKSKEEIYQLIDPYRRVDKAECIVPFSGGRDSCYALHIIVKELQLKPITYTYDWGMVTDLARRNVSRMCSELGVENIIIAADITKKRKNIRKNLLAWLKNPHLGMISILTAGDKHFFRYNEVIKRQTGVNLNLWGTNPLEVTHFKSGFLGVKPSFKKNKVYLSGFKSQLEYHLLRLAVMIKNPSYFNISLWDTLSGEYYRSFMRKEDYFHIFDYWEWNEDIVNKTLDSYGWEKAPDTSTTWRIGDGTAAFYNYIYYTVAGFTEHDTFRSNQIREGHISRERALELVYEENKPRYENIKWYLDTLELDFEWVMKKINAIPKIYTEANNE